MGNEQTKRELNTRLLLHAFTEKRSLTISQIQSLLGINRQSAYHYLRRLKEIGCIFTNTRVLRQVVYTLENYQEPALSYDRITNSSIRNFLILDALSKNHMTPTQLRKYFSVTPSISEELSEFSLGIRRSRFDQILHALIEADYIQQNSQTCALFPSGTKLPLFIKLTEDDFYHLYYHLLNITKEHPYYQQLHSICRKQALLLDDIEDSDNIQEQYTVTGRRYSQSQNLHRLINMLNDFPYQKNILTYTYTSRRGNTHCISLATGLIVYSLEKDKLYIMGHTADEKKSSYIIDAASIRQITISDLLNDSYASPYYKEMYDTMFSISLEKPANVIVEFDDIFNIRKKLHNLCVHRKKSCLTAQNGRLIYQDTISGLNDFANYLRQFGRSCYVKEPIELREKMLWSVNRTLERYKEVTDNA